MTDLVESPGPVRHGRSDRPPPIPTALPAPCALPPAPIIPGLNKVSTQVCTLAGITTAVSAQVSLRLSEGLARVPRQKALQAYSDALAPLGEAMTELGRLQTEIVYFNFMLGPPIRTRMRDPARKMWENCWISSRASTGAVFLIGWGAGGQLQVGPHGRRLLMVDGALGEAYQAALDATKDRHRLLRRTHTATMPITRTATDRDSAWADAPRASPVSSP
ncbi:hypothetical protein [Streptomyces sp. NPDC001508]|uniref:hypothetical protein n=1 Tax=Streptomyces sp. NPDC001508 TaxID=3154656 RepID=UPI0033238CCA